MRSKNIQEDYSSVLGQLNEETQLHSKRVALICELLAPQMRLDSNIAYKVGLLHDVGKIYIPSRILKKNHCLTQLEREIIDLHSYFGYKLLKSIGEPPIVYMPALFHHGFWKDKLTHDDEPLTGEIIKYVYLVHAVDIYDAVTNRRVYHEAASKSVVMDILKEDVMCTDEIRQLIEQTDIEKNISEKLN
jgi:putative nucleotidyltransferase with HDIG domain